MPYFLQSPRLGLREWTREDIALAADLWGDDTVTKYIGGPFSPEQIQEKLAREVATGQLYGLQYWPVFLLHNDEFIGCCGLRPYTRDGVYELGFHIKSAHWGCRYATEAARTVIHHAFDTLHAEGLFAGHHPQNTASARLLQKLGFQFTHNEFYPPTGLHHPSYFLGGSSVEER